MVQSTLIYRTDGLPLSGSVDDDNEANSSSLAEIKKQAKLLTRKITPNSEPRASITTGNFTIHYLLSNSIIYICITDKSYPGKLAFSFLEEIQNEFQTSYPESKVLLQSLRPYAFIEFDNFISKTKRLYQDSRATSNLDRLNSDLQDVTKVMTKNIEDLLYRGDSLDKMSDISSNLKMESKRYKRAAVRINFEALIRQYIPIVGVSLVFLLLIYLMFIR